MNLYETDIRFFVEEENYSRSFKPTRKAFIDNYFLLKELTEFIGISDPKNFLTLPIINAQTEIVDGAGQIVLTALIFSHRLGSGEFFIDDLSRGTAPQMPFLYSSVEINHPGDDVIEDEAPDIDVLESCGLIRDHNIYPVLTQNYKIISGECVESNVFDESFYLTRPCASRLSRLLKMAHIYKDKNTRDVYEYR